MIRLVTRGGCALVLVILAMVSVAACDKGDQAAAAPPPVVAVDEATVVTAPATVITLEVTTKVKGTVEPWDSVALNFSMPGKIVALPWEAGDTIAEGDEVGRLDDTTYKLSVKQAKAARAIAKANYDAAKRELERMSKLAKGGAIPSANVDKLEDAFAMAEAQLFQTGVALEMAKQPLEDVVLTAPMGGTIASVSGAVGELYAPGSPYPVVEILDVSKLKVRVQLPTVTAYEVTYPTPVEIVVPGGGTVPGTLAKQGVKANGAKGTIPAEVHVTVPSKLVTGMEVEVRIAESYPGVTVIPDEAVIHREGGLWVFVKAGDTVEKRKVVLGREAKGVVAVVQGVTSGELVVVDGQLGLIDGQRVVEVVQ